MTDKINPKPDKETKTEIIFERSVTFNKDFKTEKNLIVRGNIDAMNIDARDINAMNIDARDINAMNIDAMNIDARDINAMNIDARDIKAWDINARNIDARDIICESRIKKSKTNKTVCRVFIQNKSQIERKEHD